MDSWGGNVGCSAVGLMALINAPLRILEGQLAFGWVVETNSTGVTCTQLDVPRCELSSITMLICRARDSKFN
eukprot:106909-Amphidinium_carterae.1